MRRGSSAWRDVERVMAACPPVAPSEQGALWDAVASGDADARCRLIGANLKLVVRVLRDKRFPIDLDHFGVGVAGLASAVAHYATARGNSFSTFGYRCICNELYVYARKERGRDRSVARWLSTARRHEEWSDPLEAGDLAAWVRAAVDRLPDRERQVVVLYYGLDGGGSRSLPEVGAALVPTANRHAVAAILGDARRRLELALGGEYVRATKGVA